MASSSLTKLQLLILISSSFNRILLATSHYSNEFECGGPNSAEHPFDCVGDELICNDNEYCSIDCYDASGDSAPGLCGKSDPGCCESYIQCPAHGICSISCSYSCRDMIIDATLSESLIITECTGYSCHNLTIHCPHHNMDNSCQLQSDSLDLLSNLHVYVKRDDYEDHNNINILHHGSLSGFLHCNNNPDEQCIMDSFHPSLCEGDTPLTCDHDIISNRSSINTTSTDLNIYAVQTGNGINMLWVLITMTVSIILIAFIVTFKCCKIADDEENEGNNDHRRNYKQSGRHKKRKETVFSDTENLDEDDEENPRKTSQFKQSLSVQVQNQQRLMDDVVRQMRRDSEFRIGDGDGIRSRLKQESELKEGNEEFDKPRSAKQVDTAIMSEGLAKLKANK